MDFLQKGSVVLPGDDVALKVQANVNRLSVLHSFATPDTAVVLFQVGYVVVAARLDARFGLTFGEAVGARDGSVRTGLTLAVYGLVVRTATSGRVLRKRTGGRKYKDDRGN